MCFLFGHMGICQAVGKLRIHNEVKWPYWAIMVQGGFGICGFISPVFLPYPPPPPPLAGRDFPPTQSIPGSREDSHIPAKAQTPPVPQEQPPRS